MLIDDSKFPVVIFRSDVEASEGLDTQFDRLLDRGERFVLITHHSPEEHENETVEERRQKALFFKQIKDRLKKLCVGMIGVEGDHPLSAAARLTATTASKAFGFGIYFANTEEQAIEKAQSLLARYAA
jgi:hypothetical protein